MADIGLIGLAVMGQNLILNMNDNGYRVVAFNRTVSKVEHFLQNEAKGTNIIGAISLEDLVDKLRSPKIIMLMVMAGKPVDEFIESLIPLLSKGDIIIDGGNSEYKDSTRRCKALASVGILFVGCGVSGGEEGARYGPSIMPGGNHEAWLFIKPILQSIAAKSEEHACCDWVGCEGAGHFVKMVHNGIEYGDMQLIAEAYHLLRFYLRLENDEIAKVFADWNKSELDSFLIEITGNIFAFKDSDGTHLIDKINDSAGQKGTGKWTAISALDYGSPLTLIAESVFARCISALKSERELASLKYPTVEVAPRLEGSNLDSEIENIRKALYASKIISYAQGFMLIRQVSSTFGWRIDSGNIALMWRGGCIIRSRFLGNIKEAFDRNPNLTNLLLDDFFYNEITTCDSAWRDVICRAVQNGVPIPAFSSALAFFDGYRSKLLPANLIQAQRDYFGAHQYELLDSPGTFHHANWTGTGGTTASSTYKV